MILPIAKTQNISEKYHTLLPTVSGEGAAALKYYTEKLFNVKLSDADNAGISFKTLASLSKEEYRLTVKNGKAEIISSDIRGANRGAATLLQLMELDGGDIVLPDCEITDLPSSKWRGFMVDLARKWHPFDTVLNYVDLAWLLKLNVLHLHFADNEGYRLPSDAFPSLPDDDSYTKDEIEALKAYAKVRGIDILPEIEVPGHAHSLIVGADGAFGGDGHDKIICLGANDIMEKVGTLINEAASMFPDSEYFHIGGDEAAIHEWDACEKCKAFMEKSGASGIEEMYSKFIKAATDMVLDLGKTPVVWEGFPKDGDADISRKTVVMEFESYYRLAPDLLESGFDVINTSWRPLYIVPARLTHEGFQWNERKVYEWDKMTWDHWWEHSKAYNAPIIADEKYRDQIPGGEICAWECTYEQEIGAVIELLPAFAERNWNETAVLNYEDFISVAENMRKIINHIIREV